MRRLLTLALLTLTCASAHAVDIYARYNGSCQQGGQTVVVNGIESSGKWQQSYPACTVTVYVHNTLTLATLFSDAAGTVPLANPFASTSTGVASWYAADGRYDVQYSGGAIVTPFAISDIGICFACAGGTGTVTSFSAGTLSPLFTTNVTNPNSTPALSFVMSNAPAHKYFGNNTGAPLAGDFFSIVTGDLPFTYSGNTTELATVTGAVINGNCAKWDASGNLVDNGAVCGGGGGGTPGGSTTQVQYNDAGSFGGAGITSFLPNALTFTKATGKVNVDILDNIYYVANDYNWSQSPAGSVSVGANTISLTPCPPGIMVSYGFTSTPWHEVLISGAPGAAETPIITATTCTQTGGANGTITFTAANAHNAGFTAGTASRGWQEAINASMQTVVDSTIVQKGHVIGVPGESPWAGKVTVMSSGITIDFSGVTVQCNMSDDCLYIGDPGGQNRVANVTILKYIPRPGVVLGTFAALRTNAQSTHIMDMGVQRTLVANASFGALVTADDDESLLIDHMNANPTGGAAYHCGTDFCSVAIRTGTGTAVGWVTNSNLSMNCAANGIDWESGNTLRVSNTVIQGFGQFGVRAHGAFSTIPSVELDNTYYEVASCTNPLGIGIAGLAADSNVTVHSSIGPLGKLPLYANTGATQYFYYVVTHSTTGGVGPPMLAGTALTNGAGNVTVKWLQIGSTGTITYDVIRMTGSANNPAPYTAVCGGGTPTTCGSVATALTVGAACAAVGSTNICSFVDNAAANTTAYTVAATVFSPNAWNLNDSGTWPGAVVYGARTDSPSGNNSVTGVYLDNCCDALANSQVGTNVSQLVSVYGPEMPVFSAQHCSNVSGGLMVVCLDAHQGTTNGVTMLRNTNYNGVGSANLKGRLLIQNTLNQTINGDLVGLVDTDWLGTLATQGLRPTAKAADSAICLDNPAGAVSTTQMCFRSQNMISQYINSLPDNASWLERLTSTLKTLKVPLQFNGSTSGSAQVGVAAIAGTPAKINLPIATGSANGLLVTDGATPQQTSWTLTPTGLTSLSSGMLTGTISVTGATYLTSTNCSAAGTAANPSIVTCSAAAAGAFSCDPAATGATCQINTTAAHTNSDIVITGTASAGARLSVTCNTTADVPTAPRIASINNGVSFTINLGTVTTNPTCYFFHIVN